MQHAREAGDRLEAVLIQRGPGCKGPLKCVASKSFPTLWRPAGQDLDLVWATVTGSWKVSTAEYFGREYLEGPPLDVLRKSGYA